MASDATDTEVDLTTLFESDDNDFCPPSKFTIVTNQDYDNQEYPPDEDTGNFYIADDNVTLTTFPDSQGNFTFYVLAESPSGEHAYKPYELIVECDADSVDVTLSDSGSLDIDVLKNLGLISLLSESSTEGLFSVSDDACPISSYTLINATDDPIADDSDLYDVLDLENKDSDAIDIKTDVDLTDGTIDEISYTFKIIAEADGGATIEKTINVNIIVCGWESLEATSEGRVVYDFQPENGDTDNFTKDISILFESNDTYCPVNFYALKETGTNPESDDDTSEVEILEGNFTLSEDSIIFKPRWATEEFSHTFFIVAGTVTQFAIKESLMSVSGTCGAGSQTIGLDDSDPLEITLDKNTGDEIQLLTFF